MYGDEFGPKIIEVMADVNECTKNLAGKGNTQFFVAASVRPVRNPKLQVAAVD